MRYKRFDNVYLFEDGKLCRGLLGHVVKTRYRDILVQCTYNGETVLKWFKPYGNTRSYRDYKIVAAYLTEHPCWFTWYTCISERDLKRQLGTSFNHYHQLAFQNSVAHLKKD